MARGRSLLLVVFVALAAFAAWRLLAPSPTTVEPEPGRTTADGGTPAAPAPPASARNPDRATAPAPPVVRMNPGPRIRDPNKVRVTITASDGAATEGAVVYVWRRGGTGTTEGTFVAGPDGAADVYLPQDLAAGKATASLVVAVPGRPPVQVTIDAAMLGRGSVDVAIPKTVTIAGRVLGPDRQPVARLPMVATTAEPKSTFIADEHVDLVAVLGRNRWAEIVHATTDESGRFSIAVSPNVAYSVVSDAEGWVVSLPPHFVATEAGIEGLALDAVPAVTLRARVMDASGDAGIPYPFLKLSPRPPTEGYVLWSGFGSADARITWPRGTDFSSEATFDASVSAEGNPLGDDAGARAGYVPQTFDLRFPAREASIRRDLRLTRKSAVGEATVAYELDDVDGQPVDPPVFVEARGTGGEGGAVAFPQVTKEARGRYTVTMPPGEWTLVVRLRQPLRDLVSFEERVTLAPLEKKTIRCRFPKTGTLSVKWPWSKQPAGWEIGLTEASGSPSYFEATPQEGALEFVMVPVGRWRVLVGPAGDRARAFSSDVEILAGKPATVGFSK